MINRVNEILKETKISVQYVLRPDLEKADIAISYHFFNQGFDMYGGGQGKLESGVLQVDVFSTRDYTKEVKEVKDLLLKNKFRLADMRDSDDEFSKIKYYHKILIFNYLEEEVM